METCRTLLKRDLRRNLFTLFAGWTGRFGRPLGALGALGVSTTTSVSSSQSQSAPAPGQEASEEAAANDMQLSALQAMSALVCCGPCFNPDALSEDGALYPWLDMLLSSPDEKVSVSWDLLGAGGRSPRGARSSQGPALTQSPSVFARVAARTAVLRLDVPAGSLALTRRGAGRCSPPSKPVTCAGNFLVC